MKRSSFLTKLARVCSLPARPLYFLVAGLMLVVILGVLHNPAPRSVVSSVFAAANLRAQTTASMSADASIQAAGRGKPYINFGDGRDVLTGYGAASNDSGALQGSASPLSMASADFDEDGVPDLISGYSAGGAGMIVLHRGNVDSIYPNAPEAQQRKASGSFTESPFLSPARVFDLPQGADFTGAGDFDADGHWDVVTASRADNALYLLSGDGHGDFNAARRIELPGRVTAFATGEINRADGLTDIVVGVAAGDGPRALVFEGSEGALKAQPETFSLAAEPASFALGRLDDDNTMDLAIADGGELTVVFGRDRKLLLDENRQKEVPRANVSRRAFPFTIRSVAIGDFKGDHKTCVSLLSDQGSVHLLTPAPPKKAKKKKKAVSIESWKDETLAAGEWKGATSMIAGRLSSTPCDGLVILDSASRKLHMVASSKAGDGIQAAIFQPVSFDVDSEPTAVMPMRLNSDALSDLVVLRKGQVGPTAVITQPTLVFPVSSNADSGAGSLRDAITQANANAGLDTISFALGVGPQTIMPLSQLPTITEAVVIDGTSQPGFAGSPIIEMDGTNAGQSQGISITGGNSTVRGLVMNRYQNVASSSGQLLNLNTAGNNIIEGNFLGTNIGGTAIPGPRVRTGVLVFTGSGNNTIGGLVAAARNVISGCGFFGIQIQSSIGGDVVLGNFIGTDVSGTVALGNTRGVVIQLATNVSIGSAAPGGGNVISSSDFTGLEIQAAADGNLVQGNFIGTDATGTLDLGNTQHGVNINNCANNTVGGTAAGSRNVISGNNLNGILISNPVANGNQVVGNFIGIDVTGAAALGNASNGIFLSNAPNNTIGGAAAGSRNIISGNNQVGIFIVGSGATENQVKGNFIGTDVTGAVGLGNTQHGVNIFSGAANNRIGGATVAERNVISGNGFHGVSINASSGNTVRGNFIGTDATGTAPLGNSLNGVAIGATAAITPTNNLIGGTGSGEGNVVAFNVLNGVLLFPSTGSNNPILSNAIFSNNGPGIDLADNGITPNDACDTDAGPNNLQNSPVLTAVFPSGNRLAIQGTLNSTANTTFTVQFFANSACDPSGFGEGEHFLGSSQVTTDQTCNASFTFLADGVLPGQSITATATDQAGNTSEFSNCIAIGAGALNVAITKSVSPTAVRPGNNVTYTITVTNNGPAVASNVAVTDLLPPQLTFVSCTASSGTCTGSGNNRSLNLPQLSVNASATLTIVATVNPSIANDTIINNTATVTATLGETPATATATVPVTVSTQAPAITCPSNVLAATTEGQTSTVVNYPAPTLAGNPTNVAVTCVPPSGSAFPLGTTAVTCTATDAANNISSCSFNVTVNQGNPSLDNTDVDFGDPIAVPNQNPPTDTFTITNASAASVDLSLASISRTGGDVGGRITNPDDSGFFTVFVINPGGADTQLSLGSTIPIPAGSRNFRVMFNPSVPSVASGTSNLSASQVLPDVVRSSVTFNVSGGGTLTVNLTGRVAAGLRLIDPADPTRSPVVTFSRSGNQFNLTYSVFDSNLNVTRASYQFLDNGGQPTGGPVEVNLAQALQAVNLVRGQSFTVDQPFSGANSHPEIAGVRVTVFDGETSGSATANLGSSAASNAPAGDVRRMTVALPRVRIKRINP